MEKEKKHEEQREKRVAGVCIVNVSWLSNNLKSAMVQTNIRLGFFADSYTSKRAKIIKESAIWRTKLIVENNPDFFDVIDNQIGYKARISFTAECSSFMAFNGSDWEKKQLKNLHES